MFTVVQNADTNILKLLDCISVSGDAFREQKYCFHVDLTEGSLLYNLITKELLLVDGVSDFFSSQYARTHWFSVPEQFDEKQLVDDIRKLLTLQSDHGKPPKEFMYVIFTTMCCNARCPYCYEIGHHAFQTMDQETAKKTADFIIRRTPENQDLLLCWMGGEPLLNTAAIDTICSVICRSGRKYTSAIATNGYRMDGDQIKKAKELWNLKTVQISLDGLEETYNRTKRYTEPTAKSESPFYRVISNIRLLLQAETRVEIHLKATESNADEMNRLLDLLHEIPHGKGRLTVKPTALFQRSDDVYFRRSEEEEKAVIENLISLTNRCVELGLMRPSLEKKFVNTHCNPDRNRELTVLPDGRLGWCDNVTDRDFVGNVESDTLDEKKIEKYKERMDELEECRGCRFYPNCIRLKCCNGDVPWCTPEFRKYKEHSLMLKIRQAYQEYIKKSE